MSGFDQLNAVINLGGSRDSAGFFRKLLRAAVDPSLPSDVPRPVQAQIQHEHLGKQMTDQGVAAFRVEDENGKISQYFLADGKKSGEYIALPLDELADIVSEYPELGGIQIWLTNPNDPLTIDEFNRLQEIGITPSGHPQSDVTPEEPVVEEKAESDADEPVKLTVDILREQLKAQDPKAYAELLEQEAAAASASLRGDKVVESPQGDVMQLAVYDGQQSISDWLKQHYGVSLPNDVVRSREVEASLETAASSLVFQIANDLIDESAKDAIVGAFRAYDDPAYGEHQYASLIERVFDGLDEVEATDALAALHKERQRIDIDNPPELAGPKGSAPALDVAPQ